MLFLYNREERLCVRHSGPATLVAEGAVAPLFFAEITHLIIRANRFLAWLGKGWRSVFFIREPIFNDVHDKNMEALTG